MIKKTILGAVVAMSCMQAFAADYTDGNIRKNDFNWMQMNLMQSVDAKVPYGIRNDTYLELEFGARSGIIDLYGYVDFFDILDREQDDRHGGDNFFAKISPRFSLDAIFNKDLSVGPFNEFYIATVNNIGDRELFEHYVGLGTDVKVPWFGLVGMNIYAHYVRENYGADNEGKWDGYMFSTNWSTPFYTFANGSYLNYQGYFDYQFAANKIANQPLYSNNAIEWYNGIYWHSEHYAVGYGLKYFRNMALMENLGGAGRTTGLGHYFNLTYKF
ncbi:outer membrane protein OmpK [Citrobacter portucalensis]|nr:outer membrane protein OmpK [Citrobacter portucalensis]